MRPEKPAADDETVCDPGILTTGRAAARQRVSPSIGDAPHLATPPLRLAAADANGTRSCGSTKIREPLRSRLWTCVAQSSPSLPADHRSTALNLQIFREQTWQMALGERAALEGILSQLRPELSIEIGTAQGGSLERIVAHSKEVHSFDLVTPDADTLGANVTLHTGDSHELLPAELARFTEEERNVEFVLVDGDHSSAGVRRDVEDLLDSPAIAKTVILIHDTANEAVRTGLDAIPYKAWPKVSHVDLDFVAGRLFQEQGLRYELWGGLGLVVVDAARLAYTAEPITDERWYAAGHLLADARKVVEQREAVGRGDEADVPVAGEASSSPLPSHEKLMDHITSLEEEILRLTSVSAHHEALWRGLMDSVSWKLTRPLRAVAAVGRRRRR
jgi:Methyltransferase domain